MDATERLLADLLLAGRNLADPNRTGTVRILGRQRISTITRADGSQFQVAASVPITGKKSAVRIIYSPEQFL